MKGRWIRLLKMDKWGDLRFDPIVIPMKAIVSRKIHEERLAELADIGKGSTSVALSRSSQTCMLVGCKNLG